MTLVIKNWCEDIWIPDKTETPTPPEKTDTQNLVLSEVLCLAADIMCSVDRKLLDRFNEGLRLLREKYGLRPPRPNSNPPPRV